MAVSDRCEAQAPGRGFAQTMPRHCTDNVQQQQGRPQCVFTPLPAAICVLGDGLEACTSEPSFAQAGKLNARLLIAEAGYSCLCLGLLPLLYLPLVWAWPARQWGVACSACLHVPCTLERPNTAALGIMLTPTVSTDGVNASWMKVTHHSFPSH